MSREVVVTPRSWSPRGEAVLAARGRSLMIWAGIPGESARVKIVHEGHQQDYAIFRDTRQPDPHRVNPRCDRYHTCGGCPLMHLDDAGQRRARRALVLDALAGEQLFDVPVGQVVPSPDGNDGFRHVVKLGVGWSDHGHLRVGAWGRRSRSIVPIPECPVAAPVLRPLMGAIAHHIIDLEIAPYDPTTDKGVLRAIVLRASRSTGEVLVTLVAGRRTHTLRDLAVRLAAENSCVAGVVLHLNEEEGNAIFVRDEEGEIGSMVLEGRGFVEDRLLGIDYRIGAGDFFQTNPGMAEVLYRDTLDRLQLAPEMPLVDLYSGVGGMALPGARITGWAVGVEEVQGAVASARAAAKLNDVPAEFVAGKVLEVLPAIARRLENAAPALTVNPARRGLEPGVLEAIVGMKPRRIAYVSCNPRALARDLVGFAAAGYRIGDVQLYDMFPNTAHVECVALLESPDADAVTRRGPRRKVLDAARSRDP